MAKTIYPVGGPLADAGTFGGPVAFSRGVKVDNLLFVSGALAMDDRRNLIGAGDMKTQTRQVLKNLGEVLKLGGATFKDVVKVTVFVKDITKFRDIHDARLEVFHPDHLPASTMVQVSGFVHPEALIEIECYAIVPGRTPSSAATAAARTRKLRAAGKVAAKTRKRRAAGRAAAATRRRRK